MTHIPQSSGPQMPYGLYIKQGYFNNLDAIHKFGYNSAVGTSFETVWDGGGIYTFPSTATTAVITSASGATDSGVKITIEGLDANYDKQSEEVTLNASGTFTTTNTYLRIHRAFNSGSTDLDGDVTITVDSQTVAIVTALYQQTQMLVYTVPNGYTGYFLQVDASVQKNQEIVVKFHVREPGGVFRARGILASFGTPVERLFEIPTVLPAHTDIRIDAKAGATTEVAGQFEMILEKT